MAGAGALLLLALPAAAQDVTLTSRDGTLAISGALQGYDGELFRVLTDYGLLTVDAEGVICDGPGCPDLTNFVAAVRVVGEAEPGRRILPPLLAAFAAVRGFTLERQGDTFLLRAPQDGRGVARFAFEVRTPEAAADALRLGMAEVALAALDEPDLAARVLGTSALVAVVSPQNPQRSLATGDLSRALAGQVANWREFGGPDMPLVVHALRDGTGFRRALEARLGQPVVAGELHETQAALDAAVGRDPWALAVVGEAAVLAARPLTLTDSCGFALVSGDMAVKAGDYPLSQPFFLLAPQRRLPLVAREFLDFVAAPEAQAAIAAAGLIDRRALREDLLGDGQRLANAIRALAPDAPATDLQRVTAAMAGGERLSLTFRHEGDGTQLTAASDDDLNALIQLIAAGSFSDMTLTFAAFSGNRGDGALSQRRAEALVQAVSAAVPDLGALRVTLRSDGFGAALPIACDDSTIGRQLNRRVEVWVHPARDIAAP